MPVESLQFNAVGSYPFPTTTTGAGTAMTVCLYNNEPALGILTQTGYEDDIAYLAINRSDVLERGRVQVDDPNQRIMGMCYDRQTNRIWASQGNYNPDNQGDRLVALDPDTGAEVAEIPVPLDSGFALAWNGIHFVRSTGNELELIGVGGQVLSTRALDIGENCRGISASPWSYVATYGINRPLVVIDLFGRPIAECMSVPGTAGGIQAVAFDNLTSRDVLAQEPSADGSFAPEGSIHDPETEWDPEPWRFRHRIYLANEADQTIYFGYLYA
ncbi:MAG: hypothetical protein HKN23_12185 [Verrucomicrobiales bacterium]|nr:hypothetical protein [Verrucomicrobiales bacterium]